MPILEGDIKIMASQVLADVPEGGGAATGTQIQDGVSNNLFPDVSELDHVYGRAAMRKVFGNVTTDTRDVYMGAHAVVIDEPDDPGVSCVLFSTGDAFDTRADAQNRVENYLIQGQALPGLLFGDHVAGQMVVTLIQRENQATPTVGQTVLLRKNEGLGSQVEQFLRVVDVASVLRTFTDSSGDFTRLVVTLSISDQLRADYPGFAATRFDTGVSFVGKTKAYESNVADAARYFGIKPLTAAVAAGSRVLQAEGIFVPLVPSSREEIGVADARMNQQTAAVIAAASGTLTRTAVATFTTSSPLFVGGAITPGTLTVNGLTDKGGVLLNGTTAVGTVDYGSGILALGSDVFGSAAVSLTVAFTPAGAPIVPSESIGLPVTDATRRLTWIATLNPPPAPGSAQVSFRSQGRWYTLQDDGSGAVRGADASLGAGALNYDTATLSLTLGANPDVPSSIIITWAPRSAADVGTAAQFNRAHAEFDLGESYVPGSLVLAWDGSTQAAGVISSENPGVGKFMISPATLPAPGTAITANYTAGVRAQEDIAAFIDGGANYTAAVTGPVLAKSFALSVQTRWAVRGYAGVDSNAEFSDVVRDDGAGNLVFSGGQAAGTINYATGAITLAKSFTKTQRAAVWSNVSVAGDGSEPKRWAITSYENRTVTVAVLNLLAQSWFVRSSAGAKTKALTLTELRVQGSLASSQRVGSMSFSLGSGRYSSDGAVVRRATALAAGSPAGALGQLGATITAWAAGDSPVITVAASAVAVVPASGALVDTVTFRTASAPVAPSGFSVVVNGVSTAANAQGEIIGTGVFGRIDYETGVVDLVFGTSTNVSDPQRSDWSRLGLPGVQYIKMQGVLADTLRYNAVAYTYLPLEASVLGLDPVRLPSDGRVPVFRRGSVVVVHHTADLAAQNVSNGQTVNLGRTNVAAVRVIGNNGQTIGSGYTLNRAAGTVTFSAVAGYSQPVTIRHRIEEAALLSDAQISGLLRINRPLSRAYPAGSKVSSALLVGDLFARVSKLFDQATWNSSAPVWSDDLQGSAAGPTLDTINYPITVTNRGAVTERWALVFTGSTSFVIVGEHLGQIGTGNTANDCAPLNPATGTPYFSINKLAFNSGWSAGNAIRLNTVGASAPVWVVRVVQQGTPVLGSDSFTLAFRGDIDTP